MSTAKLDQKQIALAVRRLSARGRYWFTRRHLFYELRRRGLIDGTIPAEQEMDRFAESLAAHEAQHGRFERLVRPEEVPAVTAGPPMESDVLDYAVRRVIVFQHLDLLLMFAKSGFHHKMVVALATADGFPSHVWGRLHGQLEAGLTTTFYALHDCTSQGYGMRAQLAGQLASWERARIADAGLHLAHAMELGVPLRRGKPVEIDPEIVADPKEAAMLGEGSYAHFEAIRPLRGMRWVFGRLVRRAEDAGFG